MDTSKRRWSVGSQAHTALGYFGGTTAATLIIVACDGDPLFTASSLGVGGIGMVLRNLLVGAIIVGCVALVRMSRQMQKLRLEISRGYEAEAGAKGSARTDSLTDLPNRKAFRERLDAALDGMWPGLGIAVMLIDLDGFKSVNDIYGHGTGDLVLCETAARLRGALTFGSYVARLGGDEFAVLLPYSLWHRATEEAQAVIAALAEEIHVGDITVNIGASIGIAFGPSDGADTPSLLRAADLAMYQAKNAGRGRLQMFQIAMDQEIRATAELKAELRAAIAAGQIVPFYQPIIDLRNNRVVEFEVLARWQHPLHGCLGPDRFIHLVESVRQATPLLVSLLHQVAQDVLDWPTEIRFSVNVFPAQLLDITLIEAMNIAIKAGGMLPSRFCIEVTESALVQDIGRARTVVDAAHRAGMTVALDDFGTGYSSLYHLRELPFDKLKIDRSFVQAMEASEHNVAYLQAILALCNALDLDVTAEGVETAEANQLLARMGCDYGQGFYYGKPMPAAEAQLILSRPPLLSVVGGTSASKKA